MDPAFERDLGYLTRFFDKLEAHARTLTPEAGARLAVLVREERERWREITELVGGAPAAGSPANAPAKSETKAPAPAATLAASARAPARGTLTVGSLFGVEPPAPVDR